MDVVLGVAVTGRVARLAMIGAPASGGQVFDQYALDLPDGSMTDLAETIVGTYRQVADSGNRVAAIRLCGPDASQLATLRQTVVSAGAQNAEVVAEAEAAAALARSVGADAALLLADDDTVSLAVTGQDFGQESASTSVLASTPIGAAGAAAACAAVLQRAPAAEVHRIMLVGQRLDLDSIAAELHSTAPVEVPPDAGFAIARGAAQTAAQSGFPAGAATMMAPAVGDATMMAPASEATMVGPAAADATQTVPSADPAAVGPQLAYSQEEEGEYELPFDSLEEFVPEIEDEEAYTAIVAPPKPKAMLMGSALAFVIASFATLAVTVAVNIRPAADVSAQPAPPVQAQADTVPGRFLPAVPHEPDPVALPVAAVSPAPAAPPQSVPINRGPNGFVPKAPVPLAPAPAPNAPAIPVAPVVPVPPLPTIPTWTTTVTTSVTPTTTTTTPTPTPTTTMPTTTTTTPTTTSTTTSTTPPTTSTKTSTSTQASTSSSQPSTVSAEPPTIAAVTPTTVAPASQAPAYTPVPSSTPPPQPAYTPPAVVQAPASAPPSSGGGSGSSGGDSIEAPTTTVLESP